MAEQQSALDFGIKIFTADHGGPIPVSIVREPLESIGAISIDDYYVGDDEYLFGGIEVIHQCRIWKVF